MPKLKDTKSLTPSNMTATDRITLKIAASVTRSCLAVLSADPFQTPLMTGKQPSFLPLSSHNQTPVSAHASTRSNRDMTGEEAFAARCAMAAKPAWLRPRQEAKFDGRWEHDLFERGNIAPVKEEILEEREGPYFDTRSTTPVESRVSSFLASIPQWQPSSTIFGLSPPASDGYSYQSSSQATIVNPPTVKDRSQFPDVIPGLDGLDKLDPFIGIRPRGKRNAEVQFVLSAKFRSNDKQPVFPAAMTIIIHQFMVANKFVASRKFLGNSIKKRLWQSLLVRLDLHETSELSLKQRNCTRSVAVDLNQYINTQANRWKAAGIYLQPINGAIPAFHECTRTWLQRDWDGVIPHSLRPTTAQSLVPTADLSEADIARIADLVKAQIVSAPEGRPNQTPGTIQFTGEGYTSRSGKRRAASHPDHRPPKRMKEQISPLEAQLRETQSRSIEPTDEADFTTSYDRGFPNILEAIHHASSILVNLAPKSTTELAVLQNDWQSHGYRSTLADCLFVARSDVLSMKAYLDSALELLSLLEDFDGWKMTGAKLEVVRGGHVAARTHEDL
ncbi:hypothetical protein N7G274_009768 [Stereocaulon virgatum]|uniref:Uncharacterized protein n=1 Tax=Stereocaulon virgatum TaxID=373712 RepID=A0ABR3ZZH5_9LECA